MNRPVGSSMHMMPQGAPTVHGGLGGGDGEIQYLEEQNQGVQQNNGDEGLEGAIRLDF